MKTRICTKCGKRYPLTSEYFYKHKNSKYELRNQCKECIKNLNKEYYEKNKDKKSKKQQIKSFEKKCNKYGLMIEEARHIIEVEQDKKCKICREEFETIYSACLDHDHLTNRFRGFLCRKCNSVLGFFNDDFQMFLNIVKYLKGERI